MTLAVASNRLLKLESRIAKETSIAFTLEGGGEYRPRCDPFSYLSEHGRRAPDGRLITGITSGMQNPDPLTASILETLNEVAAGRMKTPAEMAQAMEGKRF